MSTLKTDAAKANYGPDFPDGNVKARIGLWTYDDDGAAVADDVIQMVPLPKGAQIIDVIVEWTALGSSCTFDVGFTGGTVDLFFNGLDGDATNGGRASFYGGFYGTASLTYDLCSMANKNVGYELSAADTVDILLIGGDLESADEIKMIVLYKVEGGIADET